MPSVAGPRRPQDRVALTDLRDSFRTAFPNGLEALDEAGVEGRRPDGDVEEASAESFPASDPPSFATASRRSERAGRGADAAPGRRPATAASYRPIEIEVDGADGDDPDGLGRDRRDHVLHEHVEPDRDGRRRAAGPERGRPRARASRRPSRPRSRRARRPSPATSRRPGLMAPLETLGFALAGYGCTTCIGNSGPLDEPIAEAIEANDLVVAAVLSGNRNFEGRIHPLARASYLASPPLVVAFALAGRVDIDMLTEPLGTGSDGAAGVPRRHLAAIRTRSGPSSATRSTRSCSAGRTPSSSRATSAGGRCRSPTGDRYAWDHDSTYIAKPPFFDGLTRPTPRGRARHRGRPRPRASSATRSRPTTSRRPARSRRRRPPATWLQEHGVGAARVQLVRRPARPPRGDDARARSRTSGCATRSSRAARGRDTVHLPDGEEQFIYDAAMRYRDEGVPLLVIAGREYGSGLVARLGGEGHRRCSASARSSPRATSGSTARTSSGWASCRSSSCPARAPRRSGLTGRERFAIGGLEAGLTPRQRIGVVATATTTAAERRFEAIARLDGPIDVGYFEQGGILPAVLRRLAATN